MSMNAEELAVAYMESMRSESWRHGRWMLPSCADEFAAIPTNVLQAAVDFRRAERARKKQSA